MRPQWVKSVYIIKVIFVYLRATGQYNPYGFDKMLFSRGAVSLGIVNGIQKKSIGLKFTSSPFSNIVSNYNHIYCR